MGESIKSERKERRRGEKIEKERRRKDKLVIKRGTIALLRPL
jgi:hypothetical protein